MKLFLISLSVLLIGSSALAQSQGLFPELNGRIQTPRPVPTAPVETDGVARPTTPTSLFPELKTNHQLEQEAENAMQPMSGNLRLVIDNVNSTLPPARNFSYCSATMTLENETSRRLESLTVSLTFGETGVQLSFQNVDKKARQKQDLTLAGNICQSILAMPQMEVVSCKMTGVSEDACKKRVEFVPIS